jgi:hypothetical protein
MTDKPCPRCLALYETGKIRGEIVMPLPFKAPPYAKVPNGRPCCFDCSSADALVRGPITFEMARITIGNDRQEEMRLSGVANRVRPYHLRVSAPGDLDRHHVWLRKHRIGFGIKPISAGWESVERKFPEASVLWDKFATDNKIEGPICVGLVRTNIKPYETIGVQVLDDEDDVIAVYRFEPPEHWIKL